jgi:hypothetical protein
VLHSIEYTVSNIRECPRFETTDTVFATLSFGLCIRARLKVVP